MELKRRNFIVAFGAMLAAGAGGLAWLRERPPVRWFTAVRAGRYPGPVKPFDEQSMKKPGRWLG